MGVGTGRETAGAMGALLLFLFFFLDLGGGYTDDFYFVKTHSVVHFCNAFFFFLRKISPELTTASPRLFC